MIEEICEYKFLFIWCRYELDVYRSLERGVHSIFSPAIEREKGKEKSMRKRKGKWGGGGERSKEKRKNIKRIFYA